jgi:hypothetical protein
MTKVKVEDADVTVYYKNIVSPIWIDFHKFIIIYLGNCKRAEK